MRYGQNRLATLGAGSFVALSVTAGLLPSCTYSRVGDGEVPCGISEAADSDKRPESRRTDSTCTMTVPQTPVPVPATSPPEPESVWNELTYLRKRVKRLERNYELEQEMDRRIDAEVPRIDAGD